MFCWINDKNYIQRLGIFLLVIACLPACEQGKNAITFYPMDSLVTAQTINLAGAKARLRKEAVLDGQKDIQVYTPKDTSAWMQELDAFRQLDAINKPINHDRYRVDDGMLDPGSNLTVKTFTGTDELPVRLLKIFYHKAVTKPRRIEALYKEKNSLYESSRMLSMDFQQIDNKTVLTSYSIQGGQKMVLGDTVTFSVKGKIQVD